MPQHASTAEYMEGKSPSPVGLVILDHDSVLHRIPDPQRLLGFFTEQCLRVLVITDLDRPSVTGLLYNQKVCAKQWPVIEAEINYRTAIDYKALAHKQGFLSNRCIVIDADEDRLRQAHAIGCAAWKFSGFGDCDPLVSVFMRRQQLYALPQNMLAAIERKANSFHGPQISRMEDYLTRHQRMRFQPSL
ncbi:MAG: hypothetical protein SFW62_01820 [Alphaproteobacteria bacterium]|nr:hypothetical protein [Alphaproteobacteria bacterium]